MSLSERTDRFSDPTFNWDWANYGDAFSQFGEQFFRSFLYAGDRHAARAAHRLPARVRDRVPRRPLQEPAARPRRRAVLHELPDPHARVEDDPRRRGLRSSACSATSGSSAPSETPAAHAARGDRRAHLQLPAVHGAADLRRAREDRPAAHRRGARPVLEHVARVPQDRVPAVAARRVRRAACSCSSPPPATS